MKRRDLPFQRWGLEAIKNGTKTLTSRCSGLAAVNKEPDTWTLVATVRSNVTGEVVANFTRGGVPCERAVCVCPWQVGVVYPPANVRVTGVVAKRVQDMTAKELQQEGLPAIDGVLPSIAFAQLWDSIPRRVANNRYARNPWRWGLTFERVP